MSCGRALARGSSGSTAQAETQGRRMAHAHSPLFLAFSGVYGREKAQQQRNKWITLTLLPHFLSTLCHLWDLRKAINVKQEKKKKTGISLGHRAPLNQVDGLGGVEMGASGRALNRGKRQRLLETVAGGSWREGERTHIPTNWKERQRNQPGTGPPFPTSHAGFCPQPSS